MGLFDFIGDVTGAAVKIAATPIAIASDVVSVATGSNPDSTKKLIKSAGEDIESAMDEITGNKI